MIKPDGVQRGLVMRLKKDAILKKKKISMVDFVMILSFWQVGEIISRFEKKGFLLKGLKLFQCPKDLAEVCFYLFTFCLCEKEMACFFLKYQHFLGSLFQYMTFAKFN